MIKSYKNLIKTLKRLESKNQLSSSDIFIQLNNVKLLNPAIDFSVRQFSVYHDRGRLKIYPWNIESIQYLFARPFMIGFKFNGNNEIRIEAKR